MSNPLHESISLAECDWTFAGYIGEEWRFRNAWLTAEQTRPWSPGSVPGSVHWDLLKLGEIEDPYAGLQSRNAEWVSDRNWVYRTTFEMPESWSGRRTFLRFDGVDYRAELFVDGKKLGEACSLFAPTTFELDAGVGTHEVVIAIDEAPREEPQIGRSSEVRSRKPRMSYGWDFAPRLVHLGVWGPVTLLSTGPARIDDVWVRPEVDLATSSATVEVQVTLADDAPPATSVDVVIARDGEPATHATVEIPAGDRAAVATLQLDDAALWWPNGAGEQPLYTCGVTVLVGDHESDVVSRSFGLRTLRLVPNEGPDGPRTDALPYTYEVNGRRLYVKGWNWVPVDAMYGRADLTERYTELIDLARSAHVNLLRVWGGGLIERELFYDLCDRAGIMVWQEFTQSSSGIDNDPPRDPDYIAELVADAARIVRTRRNHPSLAVWCGGNELATGEEMTPVTKEHPNIAALAAVVAEHDPGRTFMTSSPTGPLFFLQRERALARPQDHHHVHGPWDYNGPVESYAVYNDSPALFHSEFGTPGASAKSSLDLFVQPRDQWPPDATNPVYLHHGSWWLQRPWLEKTFGTVDDVEDFILLAQWMQADLLAYSLDANRRRWPTCSGSIPWQLNEPWPNVSCTAAVDYFLRPKPAYWTVRASNAPIAASLRHDGLALAASTLEASVWVISDDAAGGEVTLTAHRLDGGTILSESFAFGDAAGSREVGALKLDLAAAGTEVAVVRVDATGAPRRHYAFSSRGVEEEPLRPLRDVAPTRLVTETAPGRLTVTNAGDAIAPFVVLDVVDDTVAYRFSDNAALLLPGESWTVDVTARRRTEPLGPHRPMPADGEVDTVTVDVLAWNAARTSAVVPVR